MALLDRTPDRPARLAPSQTLAPPPIRAPLPPRAARRRARHAATRSAAAASAAAAAAAAEWSADKDEDQWCAYDDADDAPLIKWWERGRDGASSQSSHAAAHAGGGRVSEGVPATRHAPPPRSAEPSAANSAAGKAGRGVDLSVSRNPSAVAAPPPSAGGPPSSDPTSFPGGPGTAARVGGSGRVAPPVRASTSRPRTPKGAAPHAPSLGDLTDGRTEDEQLRWAMRESMQCAGVPLGVEAADAALSADGDVGMRARHLSPGRRAGEAGGEAAKSPTGGARTKPGDAAAAAAVDSAAGGGRVAGSPGVSAAAGWAAADSPAGTAVVALEQQVQQLLGVVARLEQKLDKLGDAPPAQPVTHLAVPVPAPAYVGAPASPPSAPPGTPEAEAAAGGSGSAAPQTPTSTSHAAAPPLSPHAPATDCAASSTTASVANTAGQAVAAGHKPAAASVTSPAADAEAPGDAAQNLAFASSADVDSGEESESMA